MSPMVPRDGAGPPPVIFAENASGGGDFFFVEEARRDAEKVCFQADKVVRSEAFSMSGVFSETITAVPKIPIEAPHSADIGENSLITGLGKNLAGMRAFVHQHIVRARKGAPFHL